MDKDINVKNFKLKTILTITTGYSFVKDFYDVFELVWFITGDNLINTLGLSIVSEDIKKHLFTIYPELKKVKYKKNKSIQEFLIEQEEKFGSVLPVTRLGIDLPKEEKTKVKSKFKN